MTQKAFAESVTEELTQDIKELEIESEIPENEIKVKQIELDAIRKKRENAINRR